MKIINPKMTSELRVLKGDCLIHRHVLVAVGAGAIPMPVVDLVAMSGVQAKMVIELCKLYEVPYIKKMFVTVLTCLSSSILALTIGRAGLSFIKMIPGVNLVGFWGMPVFSGASTYALGKIFQKHFEAGGKMNDMDPKTLKEDFRRFMGEGKTVVLKVQKATEQTEKVSV